MGRDQMRVLLCAAASVALIVAGALVMDWYRLSASAADVGSFLVDLRRVKTCSAGGVCTGAPLRILPGMFPTMAAITLWSSLGFAAFVVFHGALRILTGNASDALGKLGYALALVTMSITIAAAYLFGPETEDPSIAQLGGTLHRSWAPLTLLIGQSVGLAAVYLAVAPASGGLGADYKPITLAPGSVPGGGPPGATAGDASGPVASPGPAAAALPSATPPGRARPPTAPVQARSRPATAPLRAPAAGPNGSTGSNGSAASRSAGATGAAPAAARAGEGEPSGRRTQTAQVPLARPTQTSRLDRLTPTSPVPLIAGAALAPARGKTGTIPPIPEHLRQRLSYVALTAELTGGGLDARREDGSSRLVLWRDVVGVVVRMLPPAFDSVMFVDVISTADSTLRILPWSRLTGDPLDAVSDEDRPRAVVERVLARAPSARLDPATRHFFETGEVTQLPDLESLRAHDARLA